MASQPGEGGLTMALSLNQNSNSASPHQSLDAVAALSEALAASIGSQPEQGSGDSQPKHEDGDDGTESSMASLQNMAAAMNGTSVSALHQLLQAEVAVQGITPQHFSSTMDVEPAPEQRPSASAPQQQTQQAQQHQANRPKQAQHLSQQAQGHHQQLLQQQHQLHPGPSPQQKQHQPGPDPSLYTRELFANQANPGHPQGARGPEGLQQHHHALHASDGRMAPAMGSLDAAQEGSQALQPVPRQPRTPVSRAVVAVPEVEYGQVAVPHSQNALVDAEPKTGSNRYCSQKKRDWTAFGQYLRSLRPTVAITECNPQHVLDFLVHLDQFGKTKVHEERCRFYGTRGSRPCTCPMRQAWGSLDSLVGRLRAAYEENGGSTETNPFAKKQVRAYLREVKAAQARARGMGGDRKRGREEMEAQERALGWHDDQSQGGRMMLDGPKGMGDGHDEAQDMQVQQLMMISTRPRGGMGGLVAQQLNGGQDEGKASLEELQAEQRLVLEMLRQQQTAASRRELEPSARHLMEALIRRGLALSLGPHLLAPPSANYSPPPGKG